MVARPDGKENLLGILSTVMKRFAAITAKFVDRPFKRYTCMGFLYSFYRELNVAVPNTFEDLTLDNYMDHYRKNPREIQIRMLKLIRSLGSPSKATLPHLGDLMVVAQNTTKKTVIPPGFFPAVYIGKEQCLTSFLRTGVTTFKLDKNHRAIVARRMI